MKIAIICDTHYGVRNDTALFLDNQKKFTEEIFLPALQKHKIDTIIHLGDLVDRRKYINFNTLMRMRTEFLDRLTGYDVHILAGNHDCFYKNTNDLNALKELLLGKYTNIKLYSTATTVSINKFKILFVPWICEENQEQSLKEITNTPAKYCMGHLELRGFEMNKGNINDHGTDIELFSKFNMVFSGHYHHKSSRDNIHYLGAPYEMTWSDYDCERGFHIFDTTKNELTFIENPFKMFHKIDYDDSVVTDLSELLKVVDKSKIAGSYCKVVVQNKMNPYVFDMFIAAIEEMSPHDLKIVQHSDIKLSKDEYVGSWEDTLTVINKSIDTMDLSIDKLKLKTMMDNLYKQALKLETE